MISLIRKHPYHFLIYGLLAIALRLVFIYALPLVSGDSFIYAQIARNWLHSGTFGLLDSGSVQPTLIRLPGYPAFMAVIFAFFGYSEKMHSVMYAQLAFDMGTCFIVSHIGFELFSERVALAAFALAALCPFTANYVALPLTETLAIFFTALALLFAVNGIKKISSLQYKTWAGCGLAIAAAILMRPDGVFLLAALGIFFAWEFQRPMHRFVLLRAGLLVVVLALLPLAPWTIRNWQVFHVFQPLAPRYANAPDEYVAQGFNRWTRTWIAEYVSVDDVYWKVSTETPGEVVDIASLPNRAFDSPEERQRTAEVFAEYNKTLLLTPQMDAKFALLARDRIQRAPLRFYVLLPMMRMTDMWLRPRIEMLPLETRWWEFDDPTESTIALCYGTLNLLLVLAAAISVFRFRTIPGWGLLVLYVVVRTLFLGTMENPEPRYTLECFPIILVFAAAVVDWRRPRID